MRFEELGKNVKLAEEEVAKYWDSFDLLKESVEAREGEESFIFFDGPPTANGKPGIHHVISRTLKDMTCRYKTMKGFQVKRKAGWDTHGLPVEIEVEKSLGFHDKTEIEAYGIEKFNEKCKESVFKYRDLWTEMSRRMAFLADMENPYITLDNGYIESAWFILDQFFKDGLIYKGAKILPYCPRCGTGLASHEVALGYKEDPVVTVTAKFKVKEEENTYFLAWTTTPWTLPSNVALAVHPEVTYVKVKQGDNYYYLAEELLDEVLLKDFGEYEVVERLQGKELEYKEYEQILPFIEIGEKAFFVTCADYVTTTDGTGIVHTAPAYGEEDYKTGRRYHLPLVNPVGDDGAFTEGPNKGTFVMDADPYIIDYLRNNDKLYSKQKMVHNYPHCWRCDSPLIYYSKPSWYIEVTKHKDLMVENNKKVHWFPEFVGEKRFGNWLENLNDWAISRTRYWGTPLNIWVCDSCGHQTSIGSIAELREKAIEDIEEDIELHRPYVDDIHLECPKCQGKMTREADVVDVWFDSGAMPFAQWHYPFEHEDDFEKLYPADFICEGIDQTRGWFYSLMAISTLLKGKSPYKNVLVNDLVLDSKGQKMSKSKGNTLDPFALFDQYGADLVRFYSLYVSPPWLPTRFDEEGVKEVQSKFFRTIKNVYAMFALYANTNGMDPSTWKIPVEEREEIDQWLISRYNSLVKSYHEDMDVFQYTKVARKLSDFVVEDVSNWYIRRNRRRFWSSEDSLEVRSVFLTTWEILLGLSKMMAPLTPFLAEELYQKLAGEKRLKSVHIEYLQEVDESLIHKALEEKMDLVRKIVNLGRAAREQKQIKVRQPLSSIVIDKKFEDKVGDFNDLIMEELNVKEVQYSDALDDLMDVTLKPDYKVAGRILGGKIKDFADYLQKEVKAKAFIDQLNTGDVSLKLGGEETPIKRDYVQASYQAKDGFDVVMEGGLSVVLNTQISKELLNEGYMREFISKVQNQRKKNGYEVSDRIHIFYEAEDKLASALEIYQDIIADETLALSMERTSGLEVEIQDINDLKIRFLLEKDQ